MEALGLDVKLLIAQIVNFAIFYFIFQRFVAKPLLAHIKKQKEDDKKRTDLSNALESAKKQIDIERDTMIASMNNSQKDLISRAKQYSEELKKELLAKAQKQADELVVSGKQMLEEERRLAKEELQKYVKDYAEKALLKSLSNNLDSDSKSKITQSILNDL